MWSLDRSLSEHYPISNPRFIKLTTFKLTGNQFTMLRIITNSTYVRGAYVGGIFGFTILVVAGLTLFLLGTPVSDILLAAPGVLIGFATLWYYFLNNPDPTLLMPNLVPMNKSGHVSRSTYRTSLQNEDATIIEPEEKDAPNRLLASYISPWYVEWNSRPTELYLVFDVGNRGNQAIMLYEYRLHPDDESEDSLVVNLSPETQAIEHDGKKGTLISTCGSTGENNRAFVQPKERITECIKVPTDISSVSGRKTIGLTLELYATSNRPVDSIQLSIVVDNEQRQVEWQANRSKLQQIIRSLFR